MAMQTIKEQLKNVFPFLSNELKTVVSGFESKKTDWNTIELSQFMELRESAWFGLGSIAFEIVRHFKPKVIVELGTHMGFSALVMALALKKNGINGKVYAVDTWEGDEHAGFYSNLVYETLKRRIHETCLENHLELVKDTFANARSNFDKVDILHIDGLHTYKAAQNDFLTYKEKLSLGSLVMFHDVNTHFKEMRKLWTALQWRYETCLIPYSHGLGLLRVR